MLRELVRMLPAAAVFFLFFWLGLGLALVILR